jgi:hypothetical protein
MTAAREDLGCAAVLVSVYVSTTILDLIPSGIPSESRVSFLPSIKGGGHDIERGGSMQQ